MPRPSIVVVALTLLLSTAMAQNGRLEAGDPQLESGEYFDLHQREFASGERVVITITSPEFDPYLVVVDALGNAAFQADDSEGMGLDVREEFTAGAAGSYTIVVTSATAGEIGDYLLSVEPVAPAGSTANPLGLPTLPTEPFAGTFQSNELTLRLETSRPANPLATASEYRGELLFGGRSLPVTGVADGQVITGTFTSDGSDFPFTATLDGASLRFETGGAVYILDRAAVPGPAATPANPLATPPGEPAEGQPAERPQQADPLPGIPADARLFQPRVAVTPTIPQLEAEPGYLKGIVVDQRGGPLAGATVAIYGTTIAGENARFETLAQPDGSYRQRVPDGIYGVSAYVERSYAGDHFEIYLDTADGTDGIEHDAADGGVENFVWYLEGLEREGLNVSDEFSYHGMYFTVQPATDFRASPTLANSILEVVLTPVGPLMDGSQGRTLVYRYELGDGENIVGPTFGGGASFSFDLYDIPLGSYSMTASLLGADGSVTELLVSEQCCSPEELGESVIFHPTAFDITRSPEPFLTKYVSLR